MRRGRIFIFLAFILILGLVAMLVVWRFFIQPGQQQAQVESTPSLPPIEVLIVSQPVVKGTELNQSMLASVPWQQSSIAPGMYKSSDINQVIGRVVRYDLQASTPLLSTMLLSEGETISEAGSPWALSIPPGMVAVSLPMSRLSSVSYAPRPGDHVNVIASMQFVDVDTDFQTILPNDTGVVIAAGPTDPTTGTVQLTVDVSTVVTGTYGKTIIDPVLGHAVYVIPSEPQRSRMVSHMLLQDVVVLQVGDFPLPGQELAAGAEATPTPVPEEVETQPAPPVPDIITLIVRPQDAVALNFIMLAQSQLSAQLSLVLRGANDTSREDTLPVTLGFLLEQYQVPVPAKLPYSLNPRIDVLSPVQLPITQPTQ